MKTRIYAATGLTGVNIVMVKMVAVSHKQASPVDQQVAASPVAITC